MKFLTAVISSVLVGIFMNSSSYSSLVGVQRMVANRRRTIWAAILGAAGFVFFMAGVIMASIDIVLQYDAQGFWIWNSILSLALAFIGLAAVGAIGAQLVFPKAPPPKPAMTVMGFEVQEIVKMIEGFLDQRRARKAQELARLNEHYYDPVISREPTAYSDLRH